MSSDNRGFSAAAVALAFILGGAMGASLAMLFAPESGRRTRERLRDLAADMRDRTLDLSEDLSRFQVLSKVPYPYLGDPFVKARMAHDDRWYSWNTALSLVQATGRSIRSREDRATTYMLDADFNNFMARASDILPDWWKRAIVYHS